MPKFITAIVIGSRTFNRSQPLPWLEACWVEEGNGCAWLTGFIMNEIHWAAQRRERIYVC